MSEQDVYAEFRRMGRGLPRLTEERERELAAARDAGDPEAVGTLALSLVDLIIREQRRRFPMGPEAAEEALHSALEQVVVAAQRFEPSAGRFVTFAYTHILGGLRSSLQFEMSTIARGKKLLHNQFLIRDFRAQYMEEHDSLPTDAEVMQALGMTEKVFRHAEDCGRVVDVSGDEGFSIEDMRAPEVSDPVESIRKSRDLDAVERALDTMTDLQREAFTLVKIKGLEQKQVAEKLGVDRTTVRDRVNAGMKKLQREISKGGKR
jgi:RNA polymerase sigma factor (sigma-70 family)